MKVSVIIAFYNKIDFLKKVLAGFENQVFRDFELVIADDGSKASVVEALNDYMQNSSLKIQHIWHEDQGWRKNMILNKAIVASNGEYIIFIDGDCIPHRYFIQDHFKLREPGVLLAGRRVRLSDKISKSLSNDKIRTGWLDKHIYTTIFLDSLFGKTIQVEKGIRLAFLNNKVKRGYPIRDVLGCNFSVHKEELLAINGFDERYAGPGVGEDTDIDLRYENAGYEVKLLRYSAVQYHIWHPTVPRSTHSKNMEIYHENKKNQVSDTPYGIVASK